MPGVSRLYVAQVVPVLDAILVIQGLSGAGLAGTLSIRRKLYSTDPACSCSWVCAAWKSLLKSLPNDDAHGKLQPIRCRKACNFATGAREPAETMKSGFARG